jgi:hypothetical protein
MIGLAACTPTDDGPNIRYDGAYPDQVRVCGVASENVALDRFPLLYATVVEDVLVEVSQDESIIDIHGVTRVLRSGGNSSFEWSCGGPLNGLNRFDFVVVERHQ